jgi:hypothetical protein
VILRVSFILVGVVLASCARTSGLLDFRSVDDKAPFSLELRETRREATASWVTVPGFHARTAAGSRWLMCKYNELAKERGFEYWTVVYPTEPNETFVIALYHSAGEDVAKILGDSYVPSLAFPPRDKTMPVSGWDEMLCGRM